MISKATLPDLGTCAAAGVSFDVEIYAEIHAERVRVFQALTIAEYMEMWSAESQSNEVTCRTELWPGGDYGIFLRRHRGGPIVVRGGILDYKPFDTILCSLEHSSFSLVPMSLLTLTLEQSDGVTLLRLAHTCIGSIEQARYFRMMWTGCLTRLVKLFAHRQPPIVVHGYRELNYKAQASSSYTAGIRCSEARW